MHGQGELTRENNKYIGNFSNNMFHGTGKITYKDGKMYQGEWKNS